MTDVYLNGIFMNADQARISPMDRGFLFADGVYEVIPAFNGVLFRLNEHLLRLQRSLGALQIPNPHAADAWQALCKEMIGRNGGGNISVYLQVTRGAPDKRDHGFPVPAVPPTVFMATSPVAPSAISNSATAPGAAAIVAEDIRWARCDIKAVALLPNILLRQQAIAAGAVEAILIRDGLVTEGSSTNVFVVKDGRIATPPCTPRILAGVTRELVVELCRNHELPLVEREVTKEQLYDADEIWVTSSSKDALPIVTLDARPVGNGRPGALWKTLARRFLELKRAACSIA
ncbi:MAG: dat [Gammaproteobacteria bacterium]|nr:dat [Gammaproteobacteria bacterium]